jgi:toxin ParE1/3/4
MARIIWTNESLRWLRAIREHIAKDSPAAADRTVDGIFEKAQLLAQFPEIGFKYPLLNRDDVRVLVYGHYRIAYVLSAVDIVHVLGVFHAALDIERYFPEASN